MSASMAEVIRLELRKGIYQMPGDKLPYETEAAKIAEQLAAAGYGSLRHAQASAWDEGFSVGAILADEYRYEENPYLT